jgi:hypothetical protein
LTVHGIHISLEEKPMLHGCWNNERGLMFNLSGQPELVWRARVINDAASPFLIKTFTQNNK